jgi:hypothetical protein
MGNVDKRMAAFMLLTAAIGIRIAVWLNTIVFGAKKGESDAAANLYISTVFVSILIVVALSMLRDKPRITTCSRLRRVARATGWRGARPGVVEFRVHLIVVSTLADVAKSVIACAGQMPTSGCTLPPLPHPRTLRKPATWRPRSWAWGLLSPSSMRRWILAAACAVTVAGCELDSPSPPAPPAALTASAAPARRFLDPVTGVGFELEGGLQAEAEHHGGGDPSRIRSSLVIGPPLQPLVGVDLWENPSRLSLPDWFEAHLAFVRDRHAVIRWSVGARQRTLTMLIERPRSPQAFGQRIALLALRGQVVRITCYDVDEPVAAAAFERALSSFELGASR